VPCSCRQRSSRQSKPDFSGLWVIVSPKDFVADTLDVTQDAFAEYKSEETVIACGCGGSPTSPAGPNPLPQTQTTTPTFDLSPFVGVWNLTLRLTEVKGSK
jgi:hypothetical protein